MEFKELDQVVRVFSILVILFFFALALKERGRASGFERAYEAQRGECESFRRTVGRSIDSVYVCRPRN